MGCHIWHSEDGANGATARPDPSSLYQIIIIIIIMRNFLKWPK